VKPYLLRTQPNPEWLARDPKTRPVPDVRDRIQAIHGALSALVDVEPGPVVNALFTDLVDLSEHRRGENPETVLRDPRIVALTPRLRQLCARGEYLLERSWARRIIAATDPLAELSAFPYLSNYQQLTRLEIHALAGVGVDLSQIGRICFLGGGPLPLSAILMNWQLSVPVDVVDVSAQAAGLGLDVTRKLSVSSQVHIHHSDAAQFDAVADSDIVVLAALVGLQRDAKRRMLQALRERMRPASILVARSAHGLRTLLYPALDVADLQEWQPLSVVHPFNAVVNSVVIAVRP
jgi:nicotianamine synthase